MYLKLVIAISVASPVLCRYHSYWNSGNLARNFGTITPYDDQRGDIRDVKPLNGTCKPVSVWLLVRHGTRYPLRKCRTAMMETMTLKEDILKSHANGRGKLCAQDIENLRKWSWDTQIQNGTVGFLHEQGRQELHDLGYRLHEKFFGLLQQIDQYVFISSKEQRTIASAKSFMKGLQQNNQKNMSKLEQTDKVVRTYKNCVRYVKDIQKNRNIEREQAKYFETEEFQQLLIDVNNRLGLEFPLTQKNVSSLHDLCRFYRAFSSTKRSPWCAIFTDEELEMMEYPQEDIRTTFESGYRGGPFIKRIGADPLKHLFLTFETAVNSSNKSFTGLFSHDTMLQMVYTALDLFKDYPVNLGIHRQPQRKWKTSVITPFAGNLMSVLHKCPDDVKAQGYKVQFFINEHETHLCKARACSWSEFKAKFQPFIYNNLDFCTNKTDANIQLPYISFNLYK